MYDAKPNPEGGWDTVDWFAQKPALKLKNPLVNLPYIVDDEKNFIVTQTNACFMYLGRKLKMLGCDDLELSACEQLLCEIYDLRNKITGYAYSAKSTDATQCEVYLQSCGANLDKLALWLDMNEAKGNSGPFFVGSGATAPDFHAWEMFDQLALNAAHHSCTNPVEAYPGLLAFHRDFAALPGNARYFASSMSKLPCNNLMAGIGSVPSGGKYSPGTPLDWQNASGVH
jgi:glutathione S-transferase